MNETAQQTALHRELIESIRGESLAAAGLEGAVG